ncbi:MAG TPA: PepSY domain-containing protein [Steroidobacteraceae bacterium]|nr:PepSY domain-containing protein [Steroidobacteraceae bacterium]
MSSARFTTPVLLSAAAAATAALLVSAAAATLQSAATPPAASPLVMPRSGLSMDQAVRMVEERYHARVVKAQTEQDEGRTLYVLRLLNDAGKVWTVRIDASSGSVQ